MEPNNPQVQNEVAIIQATPKVNNFQSSEDVKSRNEIGGDIESALFVKNKEKGVLSAHKSSTKPVTLTFKDLSYSVQVKNSKKQNVNDEKCKV